MAEFKIYTDGSCLGNPGAGGYAAVIIGKSGVEEISGGEMQTTNNRMELTAAIVALKKMAIGDSAEIFTDSSYLKNSFTQHWLDNWKRKNWRTSTGNAVLNQDLWLELDALISRRNIKFNWVKGHAGNFYNERCDKLARDAAKKFQTLAKNPPPKIYTPQPKIYTHQPKIDTTQSKIDKPQPKIDNLSPKIKIPNYKAEVEQLTLF